MKKKEDDSFIHFLGNSPISAMDVPRVKHIHAPTIQHQLKKIKHRISEWDGMDGWSALH